MQNIRIGASDRTPKRLTVVIGLCLCSAVTKFDQQFHCTRHPRASPWPATRHGRIKHLHFFAVLRREKKIAYLILQWTFISIQDARVIQHDGMFGETSNTVSQPANYFSLVEGDGFGVNIKSAVSCSESAPFVHRQQTFPKSGRDTCDPLTSNSLLGGRTLLCQWRFGLTCALIVDACWGNPHVAVVGKYYSGAEGKIMDMVFTSFYERRRNNHAASLSKFAIPQTSRVQREHSVVMNLVSSISKIQRIATCSFTLHITCECCEEWKYCYHILHINTSHLLAREIIREGISTVLTKMCRDLSISPVAYRGRQQTIPRMSHIFSIQYICSYRGTKLVSCTGRHLTSVCPWISRAMFFATADCSAFD